MAYDAARAVTVLFGGYTSTEYDSETWEWNGSGGGAWTQRVVSGPSPRDSHAMAYDASRAVTVLFGGTSGVGDTWEWNGTQWTQRMVSGPSRRYGHAMAYDAARAETVLFGGHDFNSPGATHGDTWELGVPCTAPSISAHPAARTVCARSSASFTVATAGTGPLAYQWRRGSPPLPIPGATSATYTIPAATAAAAGLYDCIVSNACGSITSIPALLTVCVADVDDGSGAGHCDGGVTVEDLLFYLVLFADGNVRADTDDGSATGTLDGGVTIEDLLYYLARFAAGC